MLEATVVRSGVPVGVRGNGQRYSGVLGRRGQLGGQGESLDVMVGFLETSTRVTVCCLEGLSNPSLQLRGELI